MPSVIIVSGGSSVSSLSELNVVYIRNNDTCVTILQNIDQYYPLIEICIIKCKNRGIDCKVHGLNIVGIKKPPTNELKTSVSFLANDWDLSQDTYYPFITQESSTEHGRDYKSSNFDVKVFVWGLNDKDQLGGMKGSKVKLPVLSEFLSHLRPIHISGGSKSLFIVSQEGKVRILKYIYFIYFVK